MKLRLIESSIPIAKLEKNIQRNVLPVLEDKGVDFYKVTNNPTSYKTIYSGNLGNTTVKFTLYSSYPMLDAWNEESGEHRDLFGVLHLGGHLFELGPISSKDPDTVDEALEDLNFEDYKTLTQDQLISNNLIEPLSNIGNYKPMTRAQWKELYKKLADEVEQARINYINSTTEDERLKLAGVPTEELPEGDPTRVFREKSDFFYKVFVTKIYPVGSWS